MVIRFNQTISETGQISLPPIVWQAKPSCWTSNGQFRFKLTGCEKLADGDVIRVIGTLVPMTDWSVFNQKRLTNVSFIVQHPQPTSPLYWQARMLHQAERVRTWILTPIRQTVSYPEEALVESFVLGSVVVLPEEIKQSIKVMGIAHVIAVSGSHLTLLIGLLLLVVKSGKRSINTVIIVICLVLYTTLVGWQPAVTRALLMSVTMLLGKTILHRQVSFPRSLVLSGLVMLAIDPWVFLNIGWQLSILATAGICWIYPVLTSALLPSHSSKKHLDLEETHQSSVTSLLGWLHQGFRLSLEATMASLSALACIWPIMIGNFGSWSWGTILSSLLLWWLFPLVISSCFIGVIVVRALSVLGVYPSIVQICSSLLLEWPVRSVTWLFEQVNTLEWLVISTGEWPKLVYFVWYVSLVSSLVLVSLRAHHRQTRQYRTLQPLKYSQSFG